MPKGTKRTAVKAAKLEAKAMGLPKRSSKVTSSYSASYKKDKDGNFVKTGGAGTKKFKTVSQKTYGKAARRGISGL